MLKSILIDLKQGKGLILNTCFNQYGEEIPYQTLYFRDGDWVIEYLSCYSSSLYGLGTCNCFNHPAIEKKTITRGEALNEIKQFIENVEREEKRKQMEIQFLDNLIASL